MRKVKALLIGGLATACLVTAMVVPASAADTKGTLAIINGMPGRKVDVCLNGKEIRSGLSYGNTVQRPLVATGAKRLRFHARDPRPCGGKLLAQRQFPLPPAGDLTIVLTKNAPRIVIFDNVALGEIPPLWTPTPYAPFAIRHAADLAADLAYRYWRGPAPNVPISPSAIFIKGQEYRTNDASFGGFEVGNIVEARATLVGGAEIIAAATVETVASHRYEWILVGATHANARWVFLDRLVSVPSP